MAVSGQRAVVALLATAYLSTCVLGVTQLYDETLWTKQLWKQRWKLDKTLFVSNPSEENPTLYPAYPDARGSVMNSLEGPGPMLATRTKRIEGDAAALDDQSLLQPAAQAVRCTVCHTLVTKVWQRLVVDLLKGVITIPTASEALPKYLSDACDKEVGSLLQRSVIYRMEMENNAHAMTFFVLRKRKHGTQPTASERAAVQLACKEVLTTGKGQLVELLHKQLGLFGKDLNALLAKHGLPALQDSGAHDPATPTGTAPQNTQQAAAAGAADSGATQQAAAGGSESSEELAQLLANADPSKVVVHMEGQVQQGGAALVEGLVDKLLKGLAAQLKKDGILLSQKDLDEDGDEYADPDDEDEEDDCIDLHPLCERWANDGECQANPNYMVGTSKLRGHCRKACGLCTPASQTPSDILKSHPALAREVQTLSNNMLQVVKAAGCGASQSCLTSGSGVAMEGGVVTAKLDNTHFKQNTGGFVLGRPSWGLPEVRESVGSKELGQRQRQAAADKRAADSGTDAAAPGSRAELQRQVDSVLLEELGGKLLHLRTEYFTYEYLYKNHTRHFHADPNRKGKIVEDWSLGTYERESVVVEAPVAQGGGQAVLHAKDLLPTEQPPHMETQSWPYVKQVYGGGDLCRLGGGRTAIRRTEVRIACSPDEHLHFLVREPDFCHYIFVVYSPQLCSISHFKPIDKPTPGAE